MTARPFPVVDPRPVLDPLRVPLDKRVLIEASAGTGKTSAITRLYLRLLLEQPARSTESGGRSPVRSILTVTFTEAATAELKSRIYAMLKNALLFLDDPSAVQDDGFLAALCGRHSPAQARLILTQALHEFDAAAIYTIHGFCRRVLLEFAFESMVPFAGEIIADQSAFVQEVARDFWRENLYVASPLFISYLAHNGCDGPEALLHLFGAVQGIQEFRIAPQEPPDPDTADLEQEAMALFGDVKKLWRRHREEVTELVNAPDLKKNIYSSSVVRKMVDTMDRFAWSAFPDSTAHEILFKWTPAALEEGLKNHGTVPTHLFFNACERLFESLNRVYGSFERKSVFLKYAFLRQARSRLEQDKERHNLLAFDDLLLKVCRGLRRTGPQSRLAHALRNRYSAALIDEFQDTDPLQYDIFSSVFSGAMPLFLIGDPKQAIYRFRGADIFTYFRACRDTDLQYTLPTNYRSSPGLVRAVNHLFARHTNPFVSDRITCREVRPAAREAGTDAQPGFVLWTLSEEETGRLPFPLALNRIMAAIADEINRLCHSTNPPTGSPPLRASSIAVLVRTNDEAAQAHAALSRAGIPSTLQVTGSVFDTYEAFELEVVLSALLFPLSRPAPLRAALSTSLFGLDTAEIVRLASDDREWDRWQAVACGFQEVWRRHGVLALLRAMITAQQTRARIVSRPGGERALTNLLHLSELLHKKSMSAQLTMAGLVQWLAGKRRTARTDTAPDEEMVRLETDDDAVTVATIHRSKGLEYPVVFCPFNWRSSGLGPGRGKQPFMFHDPDNGDAATLALDSGSIERFHTAAQEEALAENMRLLYVALTRARQRCYCVWSSGKSSDISGLTWLLFGSTLGTPCTEALMQKMGTLAAGSGVREIQKRIAGAETFIEHAPLPRATLQTAVPVQKKERELSCRSFEAVIPAPRSILSYSSITRGSGGERDPEQDHDLFTGIPVSAPAGPDKDYSNIAAFPHGAKAGSFLHALLENMDFTAPEGALASCAGRLLAYGFDP
ncbi:MAG: UvrD-helicase domain-containing protein, partial [Chitinispirillaceae bacterium]|nr:UvrD-helicase domain-containing protein [Chitinispirillaceae bacterium]